MSRGTLYVCPELDHLSLDSLEYFERFAHDLWTCDPRHIGLVNLALRAKCPRYSIKTPIIQHNEVSVLRQGLSRIERLTMMNYRGSKKLWGGLRPGSNPICRMNHVVPIRSGVQSFNRLPYDPRLHGEDLKRVFLGSWGPRHSFNHWFKLLSKLRVQHEHKVIYQFGSCRGATSGYGDHYFPTISDRESATEWLRYDNDELRERFERNNRLPDLKGQICHKITRLFEESPQPVVGFWLFPMESVLTPDDPNIHDTDTPPADPKIVNMSKNMPELCLGNIF
ncbi:hypothetical protein DER46DRAFT_604644 [Fusarium sp. MPI-SDFR-AT-0072]|nr:hypothetical protein DER46DRAFT_604644 [Fusarium sp. MPI-SDFR-AT-0072]